jgi:multidrug transporter EmrE-like cation transporter
MSIYLKIIPLILVGVLLNAFAQISMKKAVGAAGMEWSIFALVKLFTHPWMITCMGCYAISILLWAWTIKHVPITFAFPFTALGFICVALMAKLILGEGIPRMRWAAYLVIIIGVCLQAFTGEAKTEANVDSTANGSVGSADD